MCKFKASGITKRSMALFVFVHMHVSSIHVHACTCVPCMMMRLTYDRNRYSEQDLESTVGFFLAMQQTLRIKKKGLLFLGVPCSSFAWISSSKHKRKLETPHGDLGQKFVVAGNKLCTRAVLLVLLVIVRSEFYFIENPVRSAIEYYPYIRYLMQLQSLNSHFLDTRIATWWP